MYLLYSDETNLTPDDNDFFVYGAIAIPCASAKALHDRIEEIRGNVGIPTDFLLKFNPKPADLTHINFIEVKQAIIESAIEHGCIFIVSLILHRIATNRDEARRNEINRVLYHFNCLMCRTNSYGLCLVDRFSDAQIDSHLREKFAIGLRGLPYAHTMRLDRVIGFHYSAIGQSQFSSLIDIILGTFRFCVNAFCSQDQGKLRSANLILKILNPLFYREADSGRVSELSLNFSPKVIRSAQYREYYQRLKDFLADRGIVAAQEITDTRMY